jgi:hypothetical protein
MFMHKYLLANLHMLRTYGETGLATLNPSDELEDAQHRFAQNHTGISQCLDDMNQSFGLPYYDCTRQARNFFSHDYLTPRRSADSMQRAMRGKIKLYNGLFRQVSTTKKMLEEQLADEDSWAKPEDVKSCVNVEQADENPWPPIDTNWHKHLESEESNVHAAAMEGPEAEGGWLQTSFRYVYFRSKFVRELTQEVQEALTIVEQEYRYDSYHTDEQQDSRDEGYAANEITDDSWHGWGSHDVIEDSMNGCNWDPPNGI